MTVRVSGLTKRYGATLALDGVDLEIASGEVHALLGHNGAGKSTIIGCLGGRTAPTQGVIDVDGVEHSALDPRTSIGAGIAVIYQHLSLIDTLTVTENLFLGQELVRRGLIRGADQVASAREALARVGADIDPRAIVGELSMGQRQMVEIAKALRRNAHLLILDEPSAALSPVEARRLAEVVLSLKAQGIAILYVTHLLNEVMQVADRATVLSGGKVVWASDDTGFVKDDLVTAISGGTATARVAPAPLRPGASTAIELGDFRVGSSAPVDLTLREGEIVALYGLIGSGRSRLLEGLFGRRAHSGTVRVGGEPVDPRNPDRALQAGIAFVPSDRKRQGLFGILGAGENILTRVMGDIGGALVRNIGRENQLVHDSFGAMSVRPNAPDLPVERYSGGNQQKVLIARWVNTASRVRVLLLDDPTQGVDVGARAEIYEVIRRLATERNVAVVFASNEPEEVLQLAHRCVVMHAGAVVDDITIDEIPEISDEYLLTLIHTDSHPPRDTEATRKVPA
ncbi:sugar ABC transporter ATP-binding protein [Microbacterium sp. kSW2-24]|uniref:sugar ABC transporter ATP-binding protein n=1 Tax=Microbacterium galbinum TaxID=2851646 RepID=UPI001FFD1C64|nr:sugar ABC transporter ATP-binding protein [Microbacterium galbinum]MCK2023340.1 sugar ABC transporter ATP-binding protein [Microbacterium galbinum]